MVVGGPNAKRACGPQIVAVALSREDEIDMQGSDDASLGCFTAKLGPPHPTLKINKMLQLPPSKLENAPTCYRGPRWPDPEFPRKIPKKYLRPAILDSQNLPPKYPENTPKNTKHAFSTFSVFWGYFLGVPEYRPEGYFFSIFCGNSGPSRGFVTGRGVLNSKQSIVKQAEDPSNLPNLLSLGKCTEDQFSKV